jgi:type II secretory pathway component GspD/PulD (secretin)
MKHPSFFKNKTQQSSLALFCATLVLSSALLPAFASINTSFQIPAMPGGQNMVTMSLRNVSFGNAFRALAHKGGFSVVVDESVKGNVTLDLNRVKLQDALASLRHYGNLVYSVKGNTLVVTTSGSASGKQILRSASKVLPLKYANAKLIAGVLNKTVFIDSSSANGGGASGASGSSGGGAGGASATPGGQTCTPDFQTNSLIVTGTEHDIELAELYIGMLDKPRKMKTWRLSHADSLELATLFASSIFNDGVMPAIIVQQGGGGGGGGAGGGAAGGGGGAAGGAQGDIGATMTSAILDAQAQSIVEGSGANGLTPPASNTGTVNVKQMTVRSTSKFNQQVSLNPAGPILMPNGRLNSLTILGTEEQLATAEALLPGFDRAVPQVVLELAILELRGITSHELEGRLGTGSGQLNYTFNSRNIFNYNKQGNSESGAAFLLNTLAQEQKIKILANPTVLASHDSEAILSIVDEVIQGTTNSFGINGNLVAQTVRVGFAGIIMNMLPKIAANGTVRLRVSPTITFPQRDNINDGLTLIAKRELVTQEVILNDNQSFVMGGLIQSGQTTSINKVPLLGDIPILGALARATASNKTRTELAVVITPHIMEQGAFNVGTSQLPSVSQVLQTPAHFAQLLNTPIAPIGSAPIVSVRAQPIMGKDLQKLFTDQPNRVTTYPKEENVSKQPVAKLSSSPAKEVDDETIRNIINSFGK